MECVLKPGDRIRVTVCNRLAGYEPGDKGTMLREVTVGLNGSYYVVTMDRGEPDSTGVIFTEGEIEADG
jgi:hypothetical protein